MKFNRKTREKELLRWLLPYINTAKRVTIPGFDKVPIYNVGLFFFRGIRDGAITRRASAVAFSLIMALFPAIIFIFTLIPVLPIPNFQNELLLLIESVVPSSVYSIIQQTIEEIITIKHGGLLSVGFVMAMFFSTNGIVSLIQAFNASVNVRDTRSWIMQRLVAILLVLILALLVTIGITLITFTQTFLNFLVDHEFMKQDWTYYLVAIGKWIIILAVFFFAYSFLYYLGSARKSKFRFISAGGTLATVLSIAVTLGFGFYIDHFGKYNALYGSIGALPVMMLITYFNCLAIILGFELNSGIVAARRIHLETIK
ncbi:MAG: YihY/virulence factor BrkB family protein [Prolixibacteraceae bacterium]|jgi:membrane protein|nr:YihY/virulence factor BrkB family protein [Prolixibacteraceae bacterium]